MIKSALYYENERDHRIDLAGSGLHMTAEALMKSLDCTAEEMAEALDVLSEWYYGIALEGAIEPRKKVDVPFVIRASGKDGA